ncbi:MAG: GNAT family N-acetyltransferase [Cellulosilyticaceae bacterium]
MGLKLVLPTEEYRAEWYSIIKEIEAAQEKITPLALKGTTNDYTTYLKTAENNSKGIDLPTHIVPSDIYFLVEEGSKRILGAIDIRHQLNTYLHTYGGNIGYGIRPSERKKGYATQMLKLALEHCMTLGMQKVLITCFKDNVGSAKTILNNGGILENEVTENGTLKQRYWISIKN